MIKAIETPYLRDADSKRYIKLGMNINHDFRSILRRLSEILRSMSMDLLIDETNKNFPYVIVEENGNHLRSTDIDGLMRFVFDMWGMSYHKERSNVEKQFPYLQQ